MTNKTDETASDVGVKKRSARFAALNRVAAEHLDQFHDFMAQEYESRGMTYVRPPSEEEEAEQQVAALLLKFPRLREHFADVLQVEYTPKRAPRTPTIDEHLGAEPPDDDAELPPGVSYEQLEQQNPADPWKG